MFTQNNITTTNGLPGLTQPALTVLLGGTFVLLMGLPVRTELVLTYLLGGILLSQMSLPGRMELELTYLKMDLLNETELRGAVRGNVENLLHSD